MFYFLRNIFLAFAILSVFAVKISIQQDDFKCDDFTQQRIEELENIAVKGDSRLVFTLTAAEYRAIRDGCHRFKEGAIYTYNEAVNGLANRIGKFVEIFGEIPQIKANEIDDEFLLVDISKNDGKLAISCKKLMMEILSEKGAGIRLNIFTFIDGADEGEKEFKWLGAIVEISKLQHPDLDELINEDIWAEHLANSLKGGHPMHHHNRRVLIEGGGPIGLLATFGLFMAGMDVKMANGREQYSRLQVVLLDASWQAKLRFLLGTKFDRLFVAKNAFGRIWKGRALISLKHLEIVAKKRLEEFVEFLEKKNANQKTLAEGNVSLTVDLPIELIYGFNVEDLQRPKSANDPNFYAILKKSPQEKIHHRIPVDIFVCAGGANDRMRDKLFGFEARIRSQTKNYGSSRFLKHRENMMGLTILEAPTIQSLEMSAMEDLIEEANFEKVTANIEGTFSRQIREQLKEFGQKLAKSGKQLLVSIETRELFSTSFITPKPLLAILRQIEVEKRQMKSNAKERENLEKLRLRILAKWSAIIFRYFYSNAPAKSVGMKKPEYRLNIDEETGEAKKKDGNGLWLDFDKTNCTFDVQVRTMDIGVKEWKNGEFKEFNGQRQSKAPIIAAVGDALASPHFYTGSGLSSGRMGVEFLVENIKKLNSGKIEGKKQFVEILNGKLNLVKENVVEWASKFIEILPKKEVGENAENVNEPK